MITIPLKVRPRFWAKVDKTHDGCWTWTGARQSSGYGQIGWDGKVYLAHRVSYALHIGPIPNGLCIDHLCRNRLCVRPEHLEAVTIRDNVARSDTPQGRVLRTGFCQRGHDMRDPANRRGGVNSHQCGECRRASRLRQKRRVVSIDTADAGSGPAGDL